MRDRELDAKVCEALGKRVHRTVSGKPHYLTAPYSSDISAAFELVDQLQSERPGWRFDLLGGDTGFGWEAEFFGYANPEKNFGQRHAQGHAETPAKAICLAFLKAKGIEVGGRSEMSAEAKAKVTKDEDRLWCGFAVGFYFALDALRRIARAAGPHPGSTAVIICADAVESSLEGTKFLALLGNYTTEEQRQEFVKEFCNKGGKVQ